MKIANRIISLTESKLIEVKKGDTVKLKRDQQFSLSVNEDDEAVLSDLRREFLKVYKYSNSFKAQLSNFLLDAEAEIAQGKPMSGVIKFGTEMVGNDPSGFNTFKYQISKPLGKVFKEYSKKIENKKLSSFIREMGDALIKYEKEVEKGNDTVKAVIKKYKGTQFENQ